MNSGKNGYYNRPHGYDSYDYDDFSDDDYSSEEYDSYDDSVAYDYDDGLQTQEGQKREKNRSKAVKKRSTNAAGPYHNTNNRRRTSSRRRKRKKKSGGPILLIIFLILVLAVLFGAKRFLDKYSYSKEKADLSAAFGIADGDESDVAIVWGNELSDIHARLINGTYYMKLDDVRDNLNSRFYYGYQNASDETGMILYCFPTYYLRADVGADEIVMSDGTSETCDYVPVVNQNGTIYLALEFVKRYTNFSMQSFTDPNRLQIDTSWDAQTVATVQKNTQIRTSGGIKSPVLEEIEKGSQVIILDQMDTWSKVKSPDSVIGYIENKRLSETRTLVPTPVTDYTEPEYTHITFDGKINMAFHNVWGAQGNSTLVSYMAPTKDVNVIAPTWYWVSDNEGNMEKACTQDYVDTAHNMGLEVWAVVDNINSTSLQALDNHTFLTAMDSRQNLIRQLVQEQQTYGFDGINVDFELIPEENGEDYIEFIRELSIACRNNGITLSVDNYPSYGYNSHYHLEEQGNFIDYVVIMGYDEHTGQSTGAGPVASLQYVSEGITMAIEKVHDKDRIINAIPFYSRIWTTSPDGTVTQEAVGMEAVQNYIAAHGMTETWDAETGQNYAEMTDADGNLIQIWVEDAQSVKQKLDVMQADGIKGVAEWKLQFETPDVWDVISNYMNG